MLLCQVRLSRDDISRALGYHDWMGSKDKAEQTTHFESLSQAEVVEEIENKLFKKKLPFIKVHCF